MSESRTGFSLFSFPQVRRNSKQKAKARAEEATRTRTAAAPTKKINFKRKQAEACST
jgi:hypothetical protein